MLRAMSALVLCLPMLAALPSTGLAQSAACCLGDDDGPLVAYTPDTIAEGLKAKLQMRIASDGPAALPTPGELESLIVGGALPSVILTVGFASGTTDLTAAGKRNLEAVAAALSTPEFNRYRVLVAAYADDGDLSKDTAAAAVAYLVSSGNLDPARFVPYGLYGFPNTSDATADSRRIQIVLVE